MPGKRKKNRPNALESAKASENLGAGAGAGQDELTSTPTSASGATFPVIEIEGEASNPVKPSLLERAAQSRQRTPNTAVISRQGGNQTVVIDNDQFEPEDTVIERLRAYAATQPKEFTMNIQGRALNSIINRQFATALADELEKVKAKADRSQFALLLSAAELTQLRRKIMKNHDTKEDFVERNIHSSVLKNILAEASATFPQSDILPVSQVRSALKAYVENARTRGFSLPFFFKGSQSASRNANIALAEKLLNMMDDSQANLVDIFQNVEKTRKEIITSQAFIDANPDFKDRGIHSDELNAAIQLAQTLFAPASTETPSLT